MLGLNQFHQLLGIVVIFGCFLKGFWGERGVGDERFLRALKGTMMDPKSTDPAEDVKTEGTHHISELSEISYSCHCIDAARIDYPNNIHKVD